MIVVQQEAGADKIAEKHQFLELMKKDEKANFDSGAGRTSKKVPWYDGAPIFGLPVRMVGWYVQVPENEMVPLTVEDLSIWAEQFSTLELQKARALIPDLMVEWKSEGAPAERRMPQLKAGEFLICARSGLWRFIHAISMRRSSFLYDFKLARFEV